MLSEKIFKTSLGVAITAGALGFGLFVGSAGPSRAQDKGATPAAPSITDPKEYAEADAAQKENTDFKKKLALLDTWKKDFPATPVVNARHGMYLETYLKLNMPRETFDQAVEILNKDNPSEKDRLLPTVYAVQMVTAIKPAPTPADIDEGDKLAWNLLNDDMLFTANGVAAGPKTQIQTLAKKVILALAAARKDDAKEIEELTRLLNLDPNFALAAYQLGQTMQRQIVTSKKLEDQPVMFWQIGRAITDSGPNALPDAQKKQATDFLTKAYQTYHGSTDGLQDFIAQTKSSPFPPAGFHLKSNVDIAKDAAAADEQARAQDPLGVMWREDMKGQLLKPDSDALWMMMMGAQFPPPTDPNEPEKTARFFNATIISMTPANRPKEILVGVEKPDVADAKLVFENALPGKMEPGEKIQFYGIADQLQKEPFMITFKIDDDYKKALNGTWTGKNATGRGAVGTKGGGAKGSGKAGTK